MLRVFSVLALCFVLYACGPQPPTPAAPAVSSETNAKPVDQSRRFPQTDLVNTEVVDQKLMGKEFMPGGTLGHYRRGAKRWDLFLGELSSPEKAAITLPDWRKQLTDSHLIPSFGGYFGQDDGRSTFVFSKGKFIAGVAGLPEKEADGQARTFAARL